MHMLQVRETALIQEQGRHSGAPHRRTRPALRSGQVEREAGGGAAQGGETVYSQAAAQGQGNG